MQTVTYFFASSIDGCIARPDHSFDFFPLEGDHVSAYLTMLRGFDAVVMGRRTYEVGLRAGVEDPYPWLRTFVVSRTLPPSRHPNVTIVGESGCELVRHLRDQDGRGIYLCGGGELARTLLLERLVDEIIVKLNPVIAGAGIPVVAAMKVSTSLFLVDVKRFDSGVLFVRYRVQR